MHDSRSFGAVKQDSTLGFPFNLGINQHENQQTRHDNRKYPAGSGVCGCGPPEVIPPFKKQHPYPENILPDRYKNGHLEDYFVFASEYDEFRRKSPLLPLKTKLYFLAGMRSGIVPMVDALSGTFTKI